MSNRIISIIDTNRIGFPDYSTRIQISGTSYTATFRCWLIGYSLISAEGGQIITVNNHPIGREESDYIDVQIPLDIGDVVKVNAGIFNDLSIYKMKQQ